MPHTKRAGTCCPGFQISVAIFGLVCFSSAMAGRLKPQHMTHRLQVSVGGRDVGDGEEQTGESFSVALDLSPQDDVGMEVFGACEEKQLSETACQAVMEEIGRRFSEYQDR